MCGRHVPCFPHLTLPRISAFTRVCDALCGGGSGRGPSSAHDGSACGNWRKWMFKQLGAITGVLAGLVLALSATAASAADKVKVGMFPVSSSLPFYVALDLGYFKELAIQPEVTKLIRRPP